MGLLYYLLEVSFLSVLFYGVYFLLLRQETYFRTNRYVLLSSIVLSFILPLISIPLNSFSGSSQLSHILQLFSEYFSPLVIETPSRIRPLVERALACETSSSIKIVTQQIFLTNVIGFFKKQYSPCLSILKIIFGLFGQK